MKRVHLYFVVLYLFFSILNPSSGPFNIPKKIIVTSEKQYVLDDHNVRFEGEVEVLLDQKLRIMADWLTIDKQEQKLHAQVESGYVIIESEDFVMLAKNCDLDLLNKTGFATQVRLNVIDGYLGAERAEKTGENVWRMEDITFTACDADRPHWHLQARQALVDTGFFIKLSPVVFSLDRLPIFITPGFVFPLQNKSRSGFLIPKFYFDYDNGFGFKQQYYHYFASRADTTVGFVWRDKKGFVLSDELRWARAHDDYSIFNAQYAMVKNCFVLEDGLIFKKKRDRYWVEGKDFRSFNTPLGTTWSLFRLDYGTDKNIGYQFYSNIEKVDDSFCNTFLLRTLQSNIQLNLAIDQEKINRHRFSKQFVDKTMFQQLAAEDLCFPLKQIKDLQNQYKIWHLPSIELNSSYWRLNKAVTYKNDFFADHVYYQEFEAENLYINSSLVGQNKLIPKRSAHLIRANYHGELQAQARLYSNTLSCGVRPNIQVRSTIEEHKYLCKNVYEKQLFAQGALRVYPSFFVDWALPEGVVSNENGTSVYFFHSKFVWEYVPLFNQEHWFAIDKWDTIFPKNEISVLFSDDWLLQDSAVHLQLRQAYDFFEPKNIFPLRRALDGSHLLPLELRLNVESNDVHIGISSDVDLKRGTLLQTLILAGYTGKKMSLALGYLYQHPSIQIERELLSNIPHFFCVDCTLPIGEQFTIHYSGQFYSEIGRNFFDFCSIKPLLHQVRLDYEGHCWGFYIGFEEKQYRDFGHNKSERAMVFSLKLNSLGSIAKRFKRPFVFKR